LQVNSQGQPERERTKRLAAWFLGPKAENAEMEEAMILHILRDYFHWRRNYFPSDEILVTQSLRRESMVWNDELFQQISEMLAGLRRHFPFYSPRYNAHMIADQTIPSILGYFAGMLYNPNNVTPEAAPVTVEWEFDVGADILRMLGFQAPPKHPGPAGVKTEFGWAHVTSGGTLANLESLWAARNVRYFPLAVRDVCMRHGITLTLRLPHASTEPPAPIATLSPRECLGIKPNQAIYLYSRLTNAVRHHFQLDYTAAGYKTIELLAESEFSIAHHGTSACYSQFPPAIFVAGTRHYSFEKITDLLGIGRRNIVLVDVDSMFRVDIDDLRRKLSAAQSDGMFPLAVVGVAGTTEEGAVDPIHRLYALRQELEQREGRSFWLHVDAAWGGYLRSLFITPDNHPEEISNFVSRDLTIHCGDYHKTVALRWGYSDVISSFLAFPHADSITVDPHKLGYIPYPCGVVAFRNDLVRHFLTQEAPYISEASPEDVSSHHHHPPTSVGPFIVEGSKPGAAVAACWLSHRMIPPDRSGYGEIIRASLLAARELYERLVHWDVSCRANGIDPAFRFVPVTAMPPDMNVLGFAVVEKNNPTVARTNALNRRIYRHFTIDAEHGDEHYSYAQSFFLSRTEIAPPAYPVHSMAPLLERAGLTEPEYAAEGLVLLRSNVMSPYHVMAAETGHKQDLLAEFVELLAQKADLALAALTREPPLAVK
jgi:glutamate/tyrosine decarboxylase-like PLP-dependent enzyme